jgi:hypothetical protein
MLYTRAARQRIALQREAALARAEAAAAVRRYVSVYDAHFTNSMSTNLVITAFRTTVSIIPANRTRAYYRLQTRYEQEHAARLAAEDALVTAREDARIANERALRAETALHALNTGISPR